MTRLFVIKSPEQLAGLARFVKSGGVDALAKVWNVEKQKGSKTPWEETVFVAFETVGRGRRAYVYRQKTLASKRIMAELKYTPALDWARKYLEMIDAAL